MHDVQTRKVQKGRGEKSPSFPPFYPASQEEAMLLEGLYIYAFM